MRQYTIPDLRTEFSRRGYKWFPFHIIGIRSNANIPNKFDDLIGVVSGETIEWFTGTTNPGTHWLRNLLNPKGTSLLKANQYVDTWKIGLHQGKYEALVQDKPVTVFRDANKNDIAEESRVQDTGIFGINIHRANEKLISQLIDKWSAGCQVLNNPADFKKLMDMAKATRQPFFTYTLLKEF